MTEGRGPYTDEVAALTDRIAALDANANQRPLLRPPRFRWWRQPGCSFLFGFYVTPWWLFDGMAHCGLTIVLGPFGVTVNRMRTPRPTDATPPWLAAALTRGPR